MPVGELALKGSELCNVQTLARLHRGLGQLYHLVSDPELYARDVDERIMKVAELLLGPLEKWEEADFGFFYTIVGEASTCVASELLGFKWRCDSALEAQVVELLVSYCHFSVAPGVSE